MGKLKTEKQRAEEALERARNLAPDMFEFQFQAAGNALRANDLVEAARLQLLCIRGNVYLSSTRNEE